MSEMKFIDILEVNNELKEKVRLWRNKDEIRNCMISKHLITKEEHRRWLERLKKCEKQKFWVVFSDKIPIGAVYLQDINKANRSSEWGFYIGENEYKSKGLSKKILLKLLSIFFDEMGFETLLTKVLSSNVIALNLYMQFKFQKADPVETPEGVINLSFSRKQWLKSRGELKNETYGDNRE